MQQNPVNFVLLQFSRRFNDNEAFKMLLVHSDSGGPLQVWIPPNWEQRVEAVDRAYLHDLIEEWRSTPPDRIVALIDELCRQSQGPIKLLDRGRASAEECQALIETITSDLPRRNRGDHFEM